MSKFRKKQYHNISYQFYWRSVSIKIMLTQHSACWPSLHLRFSLPFSFSPSLSLSLSVALAPMSESVIKMIRVTVRVAISWSYDFLCAHISNCCTTLRVNTDTCFKRKQQRTPSSHVVPGLANHIPLWLPRWNRPKTLNKWPRWP